MQTLITQTLNPLVPNQWEFTVLGVGVLTVLLFVVVLIDIMRARHLSGVARAVWILIALVVPVLGSVLWFLIGRRDDARNRATNHTATTS